MQPLTRDRSQEVNRTEGQHLIPGTPKKFPEAKRKF
jgi:hypothetical protein